jgi:pimeloyl-ACP methyl ester carboxylesterase
LNASIANQLRNAIASTICLLAVCCGATAQVISVPFNEKGFLFSDAPTLTFVWIGEKARATLVFIPGGEGRIGLTADRKSLGGFYAATLKPLSDPNLTSGLFNVVVFDSPVALPPGNDYPHSRQSKEHLLRVESVARHFRDQYSRPIWIMGHSNGAASMTEFYKMLEQNDQTALVSGLIYSSARNGSSFSDKTDIPVLFLAHERDGCAKSLPSASRAVYERMRSTNLQKIDYIQIRGGDEQPQNPCMSGFHMFHQASNEVLQAIDQFANSIVPPEQ